MSVASVLEQRALVLLDGAMGTELARRGFRVKHALWSAKVLLEAPEAVLAVHLDYLEAGADVISTASYQISELGFRQHGQSEAEARRALVSAIELGLAALHRHEEYTGQADRALVVSLGPYGAILADGSEYTGAYARTHAELVRFHRDRLAVIADLGPATVAFETFPTVEEAEAAIEALEDFRNLSAYLSVVPRTDPLPLERLRSPRLVAVSFNCGGPEETFDEAARVAASSPYPVLAYPNRGGTWDAEQKRWRRNEALALEHWVERARADGLRGLGGCCEMGPDIIRMLRSQIDARAPSRNR